MATKPNFKKFLRVIGANLLRARTSQELSLTSVARSIRTSPKTLRRIEQGEHNMRIELLERICKFYRVSPGEVATEKKKRSQSTSN